MSASKELLNVGGGLPAKLVGGAVITALISSVRPFTVIGNNEAGFRRRLGKVNRTTVAPDENAPRMVKILRKIKPDRSGEPVPKMLKPGLRWAWPLTDSIEVVSTQPRTLDLGIVPVERGYRKVKHEKTGKWATEQPPRLTQHNVHAEISWRVSPDGFNPYRAVDEVDDREAMVKRVCRGAIARTAQSIDNIQTADQNLLTSLVQYHSYEQLLKIGVELLHVTGTGDARTFGEMVQPRDGSVSSPQPFIVANESGVAEGGGPDLHIVS